MTKNSNADFINYLATFPDAGVRTIVVKALRSQASEAAYTMALKALNDPNDDVAQEACFTLNSLFESHAADKLGKSKAETVALCAAFERIDKLRWPEDEDERTGAELAADEKNYRRARDCQSLLVNLLSRRFTLDADLLIPFVCAHRSADEFGKGVWHQLGSIGRSFPLKISAPIYKRLLSQRGDEVENYIFNIGGLMAFDQPLAQECREELLALMSDDRSEFVHYMTLGMLSNIGVSDPAIKAVAKAARDDKSKRVRDRARKMLGERSK